MFKAILVLSLLLISISLFAQGSYPDIYDTLYVVLRMQGSIGYYIVPNLYHGGVTPTIETSDGVGDGYSQFTLTDFSLRTYKSFLINPIPENYRLDSAVFYIKESWCYGDGEGGTFPNWYNGEYYPCMLAHVDYGESFELTDWNPTFYSDIGNLTDSWVYDYVSLNMASAYLADVDANRQYCQLMIYFHILTDYDHIGDIVEFCNGNDPIMPPMLVLHYVSTVENEDDTNSRAPVSIYPNPVKDSFNMKVYNYLTIDNVEIYNLKGQRMDNIEMKSISKSELQVTLNHQSLPTGVYILQYTISTGQKVLKQSKKIMVL